MGEVAVMTNVWGDTINAAPQGDTGIYPLTFSPSPTPPPPPQLFIGIFNQISH